MNYSWAHAFHVGGVCQWCLPSIDSSQPVPGWGGLIMAQLNLTGLSDDLWNKCKALSTFCKADRWILWGCLGARGGKFSWGGTAGEVWRREGKGRSPICVWGGSRSRFQSVQRWPCPLPSHPGCPTGSWQGWKQTVLSFKECRAKAGGWHWSQAGGVPAGPKWDLNKFAHHRCQHSACKPSLLHTVVPGLSDDTLAQTLGQNC